ncbi:MAG: MFS transporter, partial [Acidimicrobiales bacterium]
YMIPMSVGFLAAGPVSGWLSDRYGPRRFATGGMALAAVAFAMLMTLPADFSFPIFGSLLVIFGIGLGLFAAPNTTTVMNAGPASQRGAASGMRATFQNTGFVLSIGIFFSLMIAGLAATLPHTLYHGLVAQGVPAGAATRVASVPPVASLFAAFLGYNPIHNLLGPTVLHALPAAKASYLTGKSFFPSLIAGPFREGLVIAFSVSVLMCVVAAVESWRAGDGYVHRESLAEPLEAAFSQPGGPLVSVATRAEQ